MLFNKTKKAEKKELQEKKKKFEEKSRELAGKLASAEQELKEKQSLLTKDIETPTIEGESKGFFQKFKSGISKTKRMLVGGLMDLSVDDPIDDDFLEDLEDSLLAADLGINTTSKILDIIEKQVDNKTLNTQSEAVEVVKTTITNILDRGDQLLPAAESGPTVFLFVGVNGVGKTTSIGKIAAQFKAEGKKVLVAAGDTFRAAAIEQLAEWCNRAGVDIVKKDINSDPSATMYEAASKAVKEKYDILLCDTSGRLHTKKNLMDELFKMQKVLQKIIPEAPHSSLLVLDANTGQNAIMQTKEFSGQIGLDGLIVTKLDGTAKGGVIIGIVNEFEIPVFYVGVGEGIQDLQPFSARFFADSLFE
jgi:fused signal recognition particle receptor